MLFNWPLRLQCAASLVCVVGASAIGGAPTVALAQESLDEIVVTGSRIVRRDATANSPIITVERELFENTSTVAIESMLNQLPQFVPAATQFGANTGNVQASGVTTPGAATVSLRGLGANRNLVLLDGRRGMPVNATMAVDINSIPAAAIERVETITGGASSVYGADAMAGVVNFVLRRDFEGVDFDLQYGQTTEGDGAETRLNGVFGANFADGRGNVLIGVDHASRDAALQREREFYRQGWADPTTTAGSVVWFSDPAYAPAAFVDGGPSQAAVNSLFGLAPASIAIPRTTAFSINDDGTVYTGQGGFGPGDPDGSFRYNGPLVVDGVQFRKVDDRGFVIENRTTDYASLPLDRNAIFGRGTMELTANVTAVAQANFSESRTQTIFEFSPAAGGWGASIPHGPGIYAASVLTGGATHPDYLPGGRYGLNCAPTGGCTNSQVFPTPLELDSLLDSRVSALGASTAGLPWALNKVLDFAGERSSENVVTSYQTLVGIEGTLPGRDLTWETYASLGATDVQTVLSGFSSLQRYRAIALSPNYGRNARIVGNQPSGFSAGVATCTSGLPIFEAMGRTISQDCIDAISVDLQNTSRMTQKILEANVQGKVADMPAGELRFAAGTSYRENDYRFNTDTLTGPQTFSDQAIGLAPSANAVGKIDVTEYYGELLIPLLSDKRLIDGLNLELGYRNSNNDPSGRVETYKALFDWTINDRLRLRGGRQVASRAPNISELFLAPAQSFAFLTFADYCSRLTTAPEGANPAVNTNAANSEALCRTLMGPTGATSYYAGVQSAAASRIGTPVLSGNPNLVSEVGETYTLGAVLSLGERTSFTIDAYQIEIRDLITGLPINLVYSRCLGVATNPTFDPSNEWCQRIVRDPTSGVEQTTNIAYSNEASLLSSGVDVQLNWNADVGPGILGVNFLVSALIHMETQEFPGAPFREYAGTSGPQLESLNGGSYDYRTFTTLSYSKQPFNVSLRWRHLPSLTPAGRVVNPVDTNTLSTETYDIFDAAGEWAFGEKVQLRVGIDNLLDEDPVRTAINVSTNLDQNSSGAGSTDPNFYDVLGRRYYVGFSMQF